MTGPRKPLRRHAAVARGAIQELRAITTEAAKDNDAGNLGVDGWIRTAHRLIDLQVRTFAGFVQASLAGPWWAEPPSGEPWPSEPIKVSPPPPSYPRTITIAVPFARVGLSGVTIPNEAIKFLPDILTSSQETFQIALKDYDYVGANYTGTLRLLAPDKPGQDPFIITVTVGL